MKLSSVMKLSHHGSHATQLAIFSLWTGIATDHIGEAARAAFGDIAYGAMGCNATDGGLVAVDQIRDVLPICPQCLALCHLAMVEHDRFREMEP